MKIYQGPLRRYETSQDYCGDSYWADDHPNMCFLCGRGKGALADLYTCVNMRSEYATDHEVCIKPSGEVQLKYHRPKYRSVALIA